MTSHDRKVDKFGMLVAEIMDMVVGTGLLPLASCSLDTGDRGLLSAFVERWHDQTSSFHLPVGEVTITLDDVASLLHLPIKGAFYTPDAIDVNQAPWILTELLGVSLGDATDETRHCRGHMFDCNGCGMFMRQNVLRAIGVLQLEHICCTLSVARFLRTRARHISV